MPETERACVEHLTRRLDRRRREAIPPVDPVSRDGMPDRREVHADLVRPPRFEPQRDEGRVREPPQDPVVGDGAHAFLAAPGRAATPVSRVADEVEADRSGVARGALDDREVFPLDVVTAKELLEAAQRLARTREDDRAGRVLVEPVHDSDVRTPAVPVLQVGVDATEQGVLLVRLRRQREEPRGLLDDEERRLLVEHDEPRPDVADGGTVHVEDDRGLLADVASRLAADRAVHVDAPRVDVFAGLAPGKPVRDGNPRIEAHAAIV